MSQENKFKKGEMLCTEGVALNKFYVIQSGKATLYIERGGNRVEIDQLGPGQIVGEQGVFGKSKAVYNCIADSEVKVIEIPVAPIKTVYEKSPAPIKLFMKALGEDVKKARATLRGIKMDQDNAPCPARFIPRLCSILVLVAKNSGTEPKVDANIPAYKLEEEQAKNPHFKEDDIILTFHTLKIYTSRMFLESHQRMESFVQMLGKLGYISLRYEKNEDTEQDELVELRIHDTQTIELFGEFYQHNLFKAGKSEMIHVDPTAVKLAAAFTALAFDEETDRNGAVRMDYKKFLVDLKEKFYIDLKNTHFDLLERKGLFMKRSTVNEEVFLQFDKFEYAQTSKFWNIIQEIDRWNELGYVDVEANYGEFKQEGPPKCPGCEADIQAEAKFCSECGHKLEMAA